MTNKQLTYLCALVSEQSGIPNKELTGLRLIRYVNEKLHINLSENTILSQLNQAETSRIITQLEPEHKRKLMNNFRKENV